MIRTERPSRVHGMTPVGVALAGCRRHFAAAAGFSALSNLLYLAPSLFMLQVYDRVIPSRGLGTLAALAGITLAALVALAGFEWLRSRVLIRASVQLESELAEPALRMAMSRPDLSRLARAEAMRHVEVIRQGIASPAIVAALDAPWTPIYVAVGFLLHPALGVTMLVAGIMLLTLAWTNERATATPMKRAGEAAAQAHARQNHAAAYSAEVRALGMVGALAHAQANDRGLANALQLRASFAGNSHGSIIKFLRLALQSAALALGAVLVIADAISAGSMIAASLLMSRALAPVEQIVGGWKTIVQSRVAYARLNELLAGTAPAPHTQLPAPTGALAVERLTITAPLSERVVLGDIDFTVAAGEVVGIVGHSGAGKSTLLRAIAGAVLPHQGHVRLDGASRADWDSERLARYVGYLPQDFILFPGTVKENIARFRAELGENTAAIDAAAIAAAQAIGAHEMISRLPKGYDTPIGAGGTGLSAGQMQRVAIARALFGDPKLLLLDEPTAHLDAEAQRCFAALLGQLRRRGTTVLFATHSTEVLASADKLLALSGGRIEKFGKLVVTPTPAPAPPTAPVSFQKA